MSVNNEVTCAHCKKSYLKEEATTRHQFSGGTYDASTSLCPFCHNENRYHDVNGEDVIKEFFAGKRNREYEDRGAFVVGNDEMVDDMFHEVFPWTKKK